MKNSVKQTMTLITTLCVMVVIPALALAVDLPDSQREQLGEHIPGPDHGVELQIVTNELEQEVVLECSVTSENLVMLPGRGMLVRISDMRRPIVTFQEISTRRVKLDSLHDVETALEKAGRKSLPIHGQGIYPEQLLVVGEPMIMRSIRVIPIRVNPIRVDMANRELVIVETGRVMIQMGEPDTRNVLEYAPPITRTFDAHYRSVVANYEMDRRDLDTEPETYLVFTPDEYESRLQAWIAWKETEGFRVEIMRKSDLPQWPSPADLRNALLAKYQGANPPTFVLFVGDEYATPIMLTYDPTHPGDYADDHYYAMMAGDDLLSDYFLGRLPAEDATEVSIMINKVLRYELNPPTDDPIFWQTSMMAASSLEPSQITTKEQTRERLETYCGHTVVHTYYENWDDAMIDDLILDIEAGVSIINYRGEGWRRGWNPQHEFWFDNEDVYMMSNPSRVPWVSSIGCGVNLFNTDDDCWGHALMSHGSASVSMGAVAVIGPTWNTHTTYNNWMDRGMYRGYCLWDINRSGPIMDYGRSYVIENFPGSEHDVYVDQHCRTYVHFGTPDMWVRMSMPHYVAAGLGYANNGMDRYLSLRDTSGALVPNAQVSWEANGVRHVAVADENGGVLIDETTIHNDNLRVVVTGKNLVPLQVDLAWEPHGSTGDVLITEIKPDIATTGTTGDMVELYNAGTAAVDLYGWILSDLDGYDTPFVDMSAVIQPQQLAVIEFVGPAAEEEIIPQPYGLLIKSREVPDFSSLEDVAVLRDPQGRPADALAWHDGSGTSSTNLAWDLTYLAGPESPFTMLDGGWWDAPDTVLPEEYETYAIDWSPFAGMGGDGSIQRASVSSPDGVSDWTLSVDPAFGQYSHDSFQAAGMMSNSVSLSGN